MRASKYLYTLAFAGLTLLSTELAHAGGVIVDQGQLPAKERSALLSNIAKARASHAATFKQVEEARTWAIDADRNRRGRVGTITMPLRSLGAKALFPMLEMLAVQAPPRGSMTPSAWTTLRVGLLEAVGELRDPRARAVLSTVLKRETQFEIVRAAAEALGRIGDDAAAAELVQLAAKPSPRQTAILAGMGECRRITAAQALSRHATTQDTTQLRIVIKSLQDVGNAGAWETQAVNRSGEGDQVRGIATTALVNVFLKHGGYTRQKAQTALLVIKHPHTEKLLLVARPHADARTQAAIDKLIHRLHHRPR